MESKLRKVENLDRAVQHLMRKMDSVETKIDTKTDEIINKIDNLGQTLNTKISMMGSTSTESVELANINLRLDQLFTKVDLMSANDDGGGGKTNIKRHVLSSKTYGSKDDAGEARGQAEEELFVAQPSNRKSRYNIF